MQTVHKILCWVVTDGKPGMENQCLGLAEELRVEPVVKRVVLRSPWRELGPFFRLGGRFAADSRGDPIAPPWPDLLIGSGRQSIIPSLVARRCSRGRTFTVQIQDPVISPRHFDLVIVPRHDRVRGSNVLVTLGALHRVTAERITEAANRATPRLAHLPRPLVAVLIGGSNAAYRLTPTVMGDLAEQLERMARRNRAGLLITCSRRTGSDNEAILRARVRDLPGEMWDGTGENPYFAYLGLADAIVVTADSVSMVSEACSTGKPVYVVDLEGGSGKFQAFHETLHDDGFTRPFSGTIDSWHYPPLADTAQVAAEVRRLLRDKQLRLQEPQPA